MVKFAVNNKGKAQITMKLVTQNKALDTGQLAVPRGLGFSIMGDSISTLAGFIPCGWRCHYEGEISVPGIHRATDTWWGQVIEHFGGHLVANSSFSGSCVEGFGFPAGCSDKRAEALVGATGELPEVVLVFMGINDYGWGGARNQVMGMSISRSADPCDLGGLEPPQFTVDDGAVQRFTAAYGAMLDNIHRVAPQARIWCITLSSAFTACEENAGKETLRGEGVHANACGEDTRANVPHFIYRVRGVSLDAYNQAIRNCARVHGAQVADLAAFGLDYESVDNTHPTALGMKQIAAMVCAQMEDMPASVASCVHDYPVLTGVPVAHRYCNKPSCEGCAYSPITANAWGLACMNESL